MDDGARLSAGAGRGFGPSALLTPANAVTIVRFVSAPVLVGLIVGLGPTVGVFVLWLLLVATDTLDGWMARRHGVTRSGAFLDPLADKVLLLGALFALAATGYLWWVPVAVIAAREVWMSAYRVWVGKRGVSVPARPSAKLKTLAQDLAVALALLPAVGIDHPRAVGAVLWVAVALTVWTGVEYLAAARRATS